MSIILNTNLILFWVNACIFCNLTYNNRRNFKKFDRKLLSYYSYSAIIRVVDSLHVVKTYDFVEVTTFHIRYIQQTSHLYSASHNISITVYWLDDMIAFDGAMPVAMPVAMAGGSTTSPTTAVRKYFPETWIWNCVNSGFVSPLDCCHFCVFYQKSSPKILYFYTNKA